MQGAHQLHSVCPNVRPPQWMRVSSRKNSLFPEDLPKAEVILSPTTIGAEAETGTQKTNTISKLEF